MGMSIQSGALPPPPNERALVGRSNADTEAKLAQARARREAVAPVDPPNAPVVNGNGQVTGRTINTTA